MSIGDYAVYTVAFVAMAAVLFGFFLFVLNRWKDILRVTAMFAVGGAALGAGLFALGIVTFVGVTGWQYISDRQTMTQCLTAHERREKAYAAPEDYFGRQLREAAAKEAKKCADFAARKQAETSASK